MSERGRYKTKQQDLILECLKKQKWRFLTVSQFMDCLREKGVVVGQTTVYRVLERMVDDGKMMKLPMEDGTKVRYCLRVKKIGTSWGNWYVWDAVVLFHLNVLKWQIFWNIFIRNMASNWIRNTQSCMAIVNAVTIRGLSRRLVCDGKMAFRTKFCYTMYFCRDTDKTLSILQAR